MHIFNINLFTLLFFRVVKGTMHSALLIVLTAFFLITTVTSVTVDVEKRVNPHDTEKGKVDALVIKGYDEANFRDDQFTDEIVIYAVETIARKNDVKNSLMLRMNGVWIPFLFNAYDENTKSLKLMKNDDWKQSINPKIYKISPQQFIRDWINKGLVGRKDSRRSKEVYQPATPRKREPLGAYKPVKPIEDLPVAGIYSKNLYGKGDTVSVIEPPVIEINQNALESDEHRQKVSIRSIINGQGIEISGFDRSLLSGLSELPTEGEGEYKKLIISGDDS